MSMDGNDPAAFDLQRLVRKVLAEDSTEDVSIIVKEVARRIPPGAAHEALGRALAAFVRDEAARTWTTAADAAIDRKQNRSPKVKAIRDSWRLQLDEIRLAVQGGHMRRLGDMSREDLVFTAEVLEAEAQQKRLKAHMVRALAQAMSDHDVTRVRDLPDSYLEKMFGQVP